MKSFCIKTNNNAILEYLLDKLDYLELEEVKYSKNKFKIYSNIIVHYIGEKISFFDEKLSSIITDTILSQASAVITGSDDLLGKVDTITIPSQNINADGLSADKTYTFRLSDYVPSGIKFVSDSSLTVVWPLHALDFWSQ